MGSSRPFWPGLPGSDSWFPAQGAGQSPRTSSASRSDRGAESGRQRRQARKPASRAAAGVKKKLTCFGLGRRAAHVGRQKTLVLLTAYTNLPSAAGSRATTCAHRGSVSQAVEVGRGCCAFGISLSLRLQGCMQQACTLEAKESLRFLLSKRSRVGKRFQLTPAPVCPTLKGTPRRRRMPV